MSAKTIVKILNFQFVPESIELPIGGEIEIRALSHSETALYSSSERKFKVVASEFETPELFPGDTFHWKFKNQGEFTLKCPLYSWMKAHITVIASENPQDPDMFIYKPLKKPIAKSVKTQNKATTAKKKMDLPSISSSVGSEDEIKETNLGKNEEIDKEIENLFLRIKEECEKDQIKPSNFLEDIEEDTIYETKEKFTRNNDIVTLEREEKKGNVVFITRSIAPSKYFPEYSSVKNKAKIKMKRREKEFRKKLKNDKELCDKVLKIIANLKINYDQHKIWEKRTSKNEQKSLIIERKRKEIEKVSKK